MDSKNFERMTKAFKGIKYNLNTFIDNSTMTFSNINKY